VPTAEKKEKGKRRFSRGLPAPAIDELDPEEE